MQHQSIDVIISVKKKIKNDQLVIARIIVTIVIERNRQCSHDKKNKQTNTQFPQQ